jgi:uncharacterized protein
MIIDGHQHVLKNVPKQVQIDKSCNIDKVILFSTLVHPETADNRREFVEEMNKLRNILSGQLNPTEARVKALDELARAVDTAPGYFIGFGSCPCGLDADKTAQWIENKIIANNFQGIGEITLAPGMVSSMENILSYVHDNNKKLPVWIHTFNPLMINDIKEIIQFAVIYNKVKFVLGHGGGSNWLELIDLVEKLPNVYMDISASFTVCSIKYIAESLPERCVFSSDLPYGDPLLSIKQIDYLIKDAHIKENILGYNTEMLLNS